MEEREEYLSIENFELLNSTMEESVPSSENRSPTSPSNKNKTCHSSFFEVSTPSLFLRIKENSSILSTHALHVAEQIVGMSTGNASKSSSQSAVYLETMRNKNFQYPGKNSLKLDTEKDKLTLPSSESYESRTGKITNDLPHSIYVEADHSNVSSKGSNENRDTLLNGKSGTAKVIVSNQSQKEKNCINSNREIINTNVEDTGNNAKLKNRGTILISHDSHEETSVIEKGKLDSNSNSVGKYYLENNRKLHSPDEKKYHKALTDINYISVQSLSQPPQINSQSYIDDNAMFQLTKKVSSNASSTSNSSTDEQDCGSKVTLSESEYSPTYLPEIATKRSSKLPQNLLRQARIQRSERISNNLIEQRCNRFDDNEIVFDSEVYTESDNDNSGSSIKSSNSVCELTGAYRTRLRLKRKERSTKNRNEIVVLISSKKSSLGCSENGSHNTKSESESDVSLNINRRSFRRRPLRKRRKVLGTERCTRDKNEIVNLISSKESSPDYSENGNHNIKTESESDFPVNIIRKSFRRRSLRKRRKVLGIERRTRDRSEIVTLFSSTESSPEYSENDNYNTKTKSESDFPVNVTRKSFCRRPLRKKTKLLNLYSRVSFSNTDNDTSEVGNISTDNDETIIENYKNPINMKEIRIVLEDKLNTANYFKTNLIKPDINRMESDQPVSRIKRKKINKSKHSVTSSSDLDLGKQVETIQKPLIISSDSDETITENYSKPINLKEVRIVLEDILKTAVDFKASFIKTDHSRMESDQPVKNTKSKKLNKSKHLITSSSDSDPSKKLETIQKSFIALRESDETITRNYKQPINLKKIRIILEDKLKTAFDFKTTLVKRDISRVVHFLNFNENVSDKYETYTEKIISQNEIEIIVSEDSEETTSYKSDDLCDSNTKISYVAGLQSTSESLHKICDNTGFR